LAIYTKSAGSLGDLMNTHKKILLAVFATLVVGISVPIAAAQSNNMEYQYSAGIASLTTDAISIKVTGNDQAPHFHWWDPNTPTVDYHVMFVKLFEANDTNADGVYTQGTDAMVGAPFALPTTGWDFSGFSTDEVGDNITAVHFNFTTTSNFNPRAEGTGMDYGSLPHLPAFNVSIEVRVHLNLSTPGQMKFDLIVDGWQWTYQTSILVLQFNVAESAHGEVQGNQTPTGFHRTETMFQFGNGYFEYEPTALAANNSLQVKASYGESTGTEVGQAVYLSFENFGNETLEYDPIIGIEPATSGSFVLDLMTLGLVGGAIVVILVIAVVVKKR
jgi:hypothetical protein